MNAINSFYKPAAPTLDVITTLEQFEQLREGWGRLTNDPLRSFEWNFSWWRNFHEQGELRIFVLRVDNSIVGIAPLFEDTWLGQKRLRFLGSGKTCTDYPIFIVADAWRKEFVTEFKSMLVGSCSILELEGVRCNETFSDLEHLISESFWVEHEAMDSAWLLSLPGDWDEFKAGSKKSLRRKIKKAEKRLASSSFEIRSTLDHNYCLEEAWNLLVKLHQGRFQNKGYEGAFADPSFDSFLKEAFIELSKEGRAEIIVGFHENEPIGAHLYLLSSDGPQLYQAGIEVTKIDCEPGHLLITHAVKRSIERGYHTLDFLRGDEGYKSYWGAVPNHIECTRYVSKAMIPSSVVQGYNAMRKLGQSIKPLCKLGTASA